MKISNYNFYYPIDNNDKESLVYNSRTNALALILNSNLKHLTEENFSNLDEDILIQLKKGGYIVDSNISELDILKYEQNSRRYGTTQLYLTIAPTLNCNFRCVYCYEKHNIKNQYMSIDVEDKIEKLVAVKANTIRYLHVTWYGGEPLLGLPTIERLSKKIIEICNKNNIKYEASIITNGFNLTREVAYKLNKYEVRNAQVTLDGPKETHDKMRPLSNGEATFDRIMSNIKDVNDLISINIRVNIDKDNEDNISDFTKIIEDNNLSGKVNIYLGFVDDINNSYNKSKCITKDSLAIKNYSTQKALRGLTKDINRPRYPRLYANYCGADSVNSFIIDPNGYLYSCYHDIGDISKAISSIMEDTNQCLNKALELNYMLNSAIDDPECKSCKYLPICMGGCPFQLVEKHERKCSEYKYNLELYIKDYAEAVIEKFSS